MVEKNIDIIQCLIQKITHSLIELHCMIYQQVLCAKQGLKMFSNVMPVVIKVINFINARILNKRKYAHLLKKLSTSIQKF